MCYEDFIKGVLSGIIFGFSIMLIFFILLDTNHLNKIHKRAIELQKGTYYEGTFIYTDKELRYIITGDNQKNKYNGDEK